MLGNNRGVFRWRNLRKILACEDTYHVYSRIWDAAVGERLECAREPLNDSDRYAVAIIKHSVIIGHLPRKISRVCSLFLCRGGSITCTVTGTRRYSADLPQGGLEVPCLLLFKAQAKEIQKLKSILND